MVIKAYILIETEKEKTKQVVAALRGLNGVLSVDAVNTPYDAIAVVESETLSDIGDLVTDHFSRVSGISRTVICAKVESHQNLYPLLLTGVI